MATKAELLAENLALKADLTVIGDRIRQEAIDRAWCDDYDRVMDEINAATSAPHMKPCSEEKTLWLDGKVVIEFSADFDVNVENGKVSLEAVTDTVLAGLGITSSRAIDRIVIDGLDATRHGESYPVVD